MERAINHQNEGKPRSTFVEEHVVIITYILTLKILK